MNGKISVILFAVATLLQLSHCIPSHRYARETDSDKPDWASRFKEYFNNIQNFGSYSQTQSPPQTIQTASNQETAAVGTGSAEAASEPEASIAAKNGNSPVPNFSSLGSYTPETFSQYQNYLTSMNPSSYFGSKPGNSNTVAGAASEPEASIAAKNGNSPVPNFSSLGSYTPETFSQYQNYLTSMNPSSYFGSKPGNSNTVAGAASEPEASIAAKNGNSQVLSSSSLGSYTPDKFGQYQNYLTSMNPSNYFGSKPGNSNTVAGAASEPEASIAAKNGNSQVLSSSSLGSYTPETFSQYQNYLTSMNPSSYFGSKPGNSNTVAGAASEPEASIAAKNGNSPVPNFSSLGSYTPETFSQYQNYLTSMNPSSYFGSKPGNSNTVAGAASEPEASIAAKNGNSQVLSSSSLGSYTPDKFGQYQNYLTSMNPSNYFGSKPGNSNTVAGAASEPEASIAAKNGNSPVPNFSSLGSYTPETFSQYQNYLTSMNPSSYFGSKPGNSNTVAGAASEPEASIAAKNGNSQVLSSSSLGSYTPDKFGQYQNYLTSMNPSNYFGSKPTGT